MSADGTNGSQKFPRGARLLTTADFDGVFARKTSASDNVLIVYAAPSRAGRPRLGLVVSRKVGNAVARNRWKRVLRAAFRAVQADLPVADYVCLPRVGAVPSLASVQPSLAKLAAQAQRRRPRVPDA